MSEPLPEIQVPGSTSRFNPGGGFAGSWFPELAASISVALDETLVRSVASAKTEAAASVEGSLSSGAGKRAMVQSQAAAAGTSLIANRVAYPTTASSSIYSRLHGTGGNSSFQILVGGGQGGSDAYQMTWTVATTSASGYVSYGTPNTSGHLAATPGQLFNASMYARSSKTQALAARIDFHGADNAKVGEVLGEVRPIPGSTLARYSVAGEVPAGAVRARLIIVTASYQTGGIAWDVGDTLSASRPQYTEGSTRLWPTFNGWASNAYWAGTPGASESLGALTSYPETVQAVSASGSRLVLQDLTDAYDITLNASCTLILPAPIQGAGTVLVLRQDGTGGRSVVWPPTVQWPGGNPPDLSTTRRAKDAVTLLCVGGTTWMGFMAGKGIQ